MPKGQRPTKRQATPRQSSSVPQMKRSVVRGSGTPARDNSVVGRSLKDETRRSRRAAKNPNKVEKVPTFGHKVKDTEAAPGPEKHVDHQELVSRVALFGGIAIALASVALVVFLLLSVSPAFMITDIETQGSAHVSQDSIAKLAQIPAGTTLLNVDEKAVETNIKKNPWVASINIERKFPNTLSISVNERSVSAIVLMNSGSVAWYLGSDGCWIEPVTLDRSSGQTSEEAALALATSQSCILISNVPATVQPVAGSAATDDVIVAVNTYLNSFSSSFKSQIVSFSASTMESLSCLLSNGVEVSLGAATNISAKETAITAILSEHAGKVTYINVRVPTNPSYRSVDSDKVGQGTGVTAETENSASSDSGSTSTSGTTSTDTSSTTSTGASGTTASGTSSTDATSGTTAGTSSGTTSGTASSGTTPSSGTTSGTASGTTSGMTSSGTASSTGTGMTSSSTSSAGA